MKTILPFLFLFFLSISGKSQLLSGTGFLRGKYMEVGIAPNGTLGAHVAPPIGYHPNVGFSLGVVTDIAKDGWYRSEPGMVNYMGDYVTPGSPVEQWMIMADEQYGVTYNAGALDSFSGGLSGSIINVINGSKNSCSWVGSFHGLDIRQEIVTNHLGLTIGFTITFKNTSSKSVNNIFYNRVVDPDNEQPWSGNFHTLNRIEKQSSAIDGRGIVSARSIGYASYFGIHTEDKRAKVYFLNEGLSPKYRIDSLSLGVGLDSGYLHTVESDTLYADVGMGVVYNIGNLKSGDSAEIKFQYVFDPNLDCEAILRYSDMNYKSGDTITVCYDNIVDAEVFSESVSEWKWPVSPDIDTSYGAVKLVRVRSTQTYKIISVDSSKCGPAFDTFTITIRPFPRTKPTITAIGNKLIAGGGYFVQRWYRDGFTVVMPVADTLIATTSGYYQVRVIDSNGCFSISDSLFIDDKTAGIAFAETESNIRIYPNPVSEKLFIEADNPVKVRLMNMIGETLIEKENTKELLLSQIPAGVYLLEIYDKNNYLLTRRKVVKQH